MKKLLSLMLFASALVLFGSEAAPAAAQEFMDYTVAPGDTCGSIAERIYGSPRRYMRIHTHNPDLGPLPHRLVPGSVLRLPLPRETSADATVSDARGSVRRQLPTDPGWTGATIGDELDTGSRVSTGERSSAELTFRASTVAAIRAETLVIVHGGSVERVREEGSHAVLRDGSILSRLSALSGGAPLVVETPAAEVEVGEGETSVHVSQERGTSVSTHRGRAARVRARGRTVEVPAGTGAHVAIGEAPSAPRPLPAAPAWTAGEVRSFLGLYPAPHRSGGGTVIGSWAPVAEAATYHVEIARREDGRDVVFQADVPSTVTRFEAHGLPPGRYYVHIATYDAERLEGRPESPEVFEVVGVRLLGPGEPAPAPSEGALLLEELDSLADEAFLLTESPETPSVLVGSRAIVPEGVVCAAGTSEPSHELVLSVPGETFLTCVGGGATISGIDLNVVRLRARVLDGVGAPVGTLARDGASEVVIAIDAHDLDVRGLAITAEGGEVTEPSIDDDGNLHATLTPFSSGADPMTLAFALRTDPSMVLGSVEVLFEDPPPPPPPPPAVRRLALHEGLGLFAMPSWVGLRDEQRTGTGATLGLTFGTARLGELDPRVRLIAGAQAGFFEDYLRIAAVAPLDVVGQDDRSADRGARDLYFSLGSRVLRTDDTGGLGMALEVGMWAPSAGQDGLDRGRLMFAVDVSLRFAERFALRTRQSGIFDLADALRAPGSMLWASAYGFDVEVAGPLSLGLEGTLTIGREDGRDWYAGGVGLGVGIDLSPVVISVAGRYGFGDDLWPTATLAANVRASFE